MSEFWNFFSEAGGAKKLWHSPWIGVPLWLISAAFVVYWMWYVPSPGKAIGVLATVAGIMSVREMKVMGKIAWVVLLICMLTTEFRAIDKDRAENAKAQQGFFNSQKVGFGQIASQAQANFTETATGLTSAIHGLQDLLGATKAVATTVNRNLENVTGGSSFAYVIPDTQIMSYRPYPATSFTVTIINAGKAILSELGVAIAHVVREGSPATLTMTDGGLAKIISAGSLAGGSSKLVPLYFMTPLQDDPGGHPHYIINIEAQNGRAVEDLYLRPGVRGSWAYRFDLHKNGKLLMQQGWVEPVKTP